MVTTFQEFQDDGITPTEMLKQRQDGHSFLRARTDWGGSRIDPVEEDTQALLVLPILSCWYMHCPHWTSQSKRFLYPPNFNRRTKSILGIRERETFPITPGSSLASFPSFLICSLAGWLPNQLCHHLRLLSDGECPQYTELMGNKGVWAKYNCVGKPSLGEKIHKSQKVFQRGTFFRSN